MRYDKRIMLVEEQGTRYNPDTGKEEQLDPIKTTLPANIGNLGLERRNELFGNIDVNIIVVRTQRPVTTEATYVLIDDSRYEIKAQSNYRRGVLFLEGDGFED